MLGDNWVQHGILVQFLGSNARITRVRFIARIPVLEELVDGAYPESMTWDDVDMQWDNAAPDLEGNEAIVNAVPIQKQCWFDT